MAISIVTADQKKAFAGDHTFSDGSKAPDTMNNLNRRNFLRKASALSATMALSGGISSNAFGQTRGIEGQSAPEIKLDYWIDADGNPGHFSVTESRGKWVFLKCFQNWCPGCHRSGFPTLQAFSEKFADHPDVAIAGIQTVFEGHRSNTLEDVRKLQLRYDLPITMGHDPGDPETHDRPVTMKAYRTGGTPWLILIDPEGTVVYNNFHVNTESLIEFVETQLG